MRHPAVVMLTFLGFSAGLPYLLTGDTLAAWQKDQGVDLAVIGFFAWIGLVRSFKFVLAPFVDQTRLPLLSRLGQRRSWMLAGQLLIGLSLLAMAWLTPARSLGLFAALCVLLVVGSAVQDIAVDAVLIESAGPELRGLMAAGYTLGYRTAMLVAGAGSLFLADHLPWPLVYALMAGLVLVGVGTVLFIGEPAKHGARPVGVAERPAAERAFGWLREHRPALAASLGGTRGGRFFGAAFVAPFVEFFTRYGKRAVLLLLLAALFKLSDQMLGLMANPFYLSLGFTKSEIAAIRKLFGFAMTIAGAGLGGLAVARIGARKAVWIAAVAMPLSNLLFVWMAYQGHSRQAFIVLISGENLANGFAGAVFVAWLSGLVNQAFTATQYALLTSLAMLPGTFLAGFAGKLAKALGWPEFFLLTVVAGLPALVLLLLRPEKGLKADGYVAPEIALMASPEVADTPGAGHA